MLRQAAAAYNRLGTKAAAAEALGIPRTTLSGWLKREVPTEEALPPKGRRLTTLLNGTALVGGDAHYWPGPASTAHRAFIFFIKELAPIIVIANGDMLDAACISRHPPIGWNCLPSVKDELEVCQERMGEIALAAGKAEKYWPLGNHDARFETRLAMVAPEFKDVHGISLNDHFPEWQGCWSVHINEIGGVVVKHRFKGGAHAPFLNTLYAGRSTITGHLHSLKVYPISDFNGVRFGVDAGCLADPYHDAFQDYNEDAPRSHRSGFIVLTFASGRLLWPEPVHVLEDGLVEFRGQVYHV